MILVVDASIATKWLIEEPASPAANRLLNSSFEFVAVDLLRLEVSSAVLSALRKGRISAPDAQRSVAGLDRLPVLLSPATDHVATAYAIAQRHGGSVYDACYIALARSLNAPLATDDEGMATVAEAVGVAAHRASRGFAELLD